MKKELGIKAFKTILIIVSLIVFHSAIIGLFFFLYGENPFVNTMKFPWQNEIEFIFTYFQKHNAHWPLTGKVLSNIFLLSIFTLPHTWLLGLRGKKFYRFCRVNSSYQNAFYGLYASATLLLLYALWLPMGEFIVLQGPGRIMANVGCALSWALMGKAIWDTGVLKQIGVRVLFNQVFQVQTPPYRPDQGIYRYLRHPIYIAFFGMIFFSPNISLGYGLTLCFWGIYLYWGAKNKDERLAASPAYKSYIKKVPFLPWPFSIILKHTQKSTEPVAINNEIYLTYGDKWYGEDRDPVALLRAEGTLKNQWILEEISQIITHNPTLASDASDAPDGVFRILDVGCGGGFLTNFLGSKLPQLFPNMSFEIYGLDLAESILSIAKKHDQTKKVKYVLGNGTTLPFDDKTFQVVMAMDVLEHVPSPQSMIQECSRLIKNQGHFFFHTFNRNLFSYLLIIKCVEYLVPNTPKNMHLYSMFIKPQELNGMLVREKLSIKIMRGIRPKIWQWALWKSLVFQKVFPNFQFVFTRSLIASYAGIAKKIS